MNKVILRLVIGLLLVIVGAVQLVRGNYPSGALYGGLGIVFLLFAWRSKSQK